MIRNQLQVISGFSGYLRKRRMLQHPSYHKRSRWGVLHHIVSSDPDSFDKLIGFCEASDADLDEFLET